MEPLAAIEARAGEPVDSLAVVALRLRQGASVEDVAARVLAAFSAALGGAMMGAHRPPTPWAACSADELVGRLQSVVQLPDPDMLGTLAGWVRDVEAGVLELRSAESLAPALAAALGVPPEALEQSPDALPPAWLTVHEFAVRAGLSEKATRGRLSRGTLPSCLVDGRRMIPVGELDAVRQERRRKDRHRA